MKNSQKIAVTSGSFSFNPVLVDELKSHFPNTTFKENKDNLSKPDLIKYLSECDGAIVGLDEIDKEVIDALPNLKIIAKYGVGLNNLDLDYMKEKNIKLGWTGGVNKSSVSELVIGQMINMSRNLMRQGILLRNGTWEKNGGKELSELTVGVIGVGEIGKDLIKKLEVFGVKILANDIEDRDSFYEEHDIQKATKEEIYKTCDVVTLHIPLSEETRYLINNDSLSMFKDGAMLINTSRGGIVQEKELYTKLAEGKLKAAAMDVFEVEPAIGNQLITLDNFFPTPHMAGNSLKAVQSMGRSAISHLVKFFGE